MWLHVGECMVDTLNTYCNYRPLSYISAVYCVGKRRMLLNYPDVWTVYSSYVRYSFVLTHLFINVTCSFFVVIQPSVCLPLSLSITTNFSANYDQCNSCPIWRFLLTMISQERVLLDNSSFYIFVLLWGFLPVPVVTMRHFSHTLYCMVYFDIWQKAPGSNSRKYMVFRSVVRCQEFSFVSYFFLISQIQCLLGHADCLCC
jgi:hypothetical protein